MESFPVENRNIRRCFVEFDFFFFLWMISLGMESILLLLAKKAADITAVG
jgi:hypothetical protein